MPICGANRPCRELSCGWLRNPDHRSPALQARHALKLKSDHLREPATAIYGEAAEIVTMEPTVIEQPKIRKGGIGFVLMKMVSTW